MDSVSKYELFIKNTLEIVVIKPIVNIFNIFLVSIEILLASSTLSFSLCKSITSIGSVILNSMDSSNSISIDKNFSLRES